MGKRKRNQPEPAEAAALNPFAFCSTAIWVGLAIAIGVVPDQKIVRSKLLVLEAGIGLQCLVLAASWIHATAPRWRRSPLDMPMALYALGGLFFYVLSPERGASTLELVRILFAAAVFFAASRTLTGPALPRAWAGTAAAVGLYALLQTRGGIGVLMVPHLDRPIATFGNPIFLAAYLGASAVFSTGLAFTSKNKERGFFAACAFLCLIGLWTTKTRAALFGVGAAGALWAIIALPPKRRAAALGALAVCAGLGLWWFQDRSWTHGLIWRDTLSMWMANPIFGCGLGRFHLEFVEYASPALKALWPQQKVIVNFTHNEYLQILAETGIVGISLILTIIAAAGMWLIHVWRESRDGVRGAYAFAAAALLAQNIFSPDIRFGVSSFIVFAFLGAATSTEERPLPQFPGKLGLGVLISLFVILWGRLAVQPIIAQRKLAAAPEFHIAKDDESARLIRDLEARLEADPENADLAENLAFYHAKRKDWPEAIKMFEKTAALRPDRPGPFNNLGNISYSIGKREEAIQWWKKSLLVSNEQIDARLNLAKTLYELGRLKESGRYVQEVLERQPSNEKAQILLKKMIE
ncbi:MAG: hypothetical protein COB53_01850 [Elusimicrobia bacterium]|nr:MAG: hypothetical protein COB53_01850 [Elusimicrobiota bacterium]